MLKMTLTFELDEEQLREIFEEYDLKFTKKKIKELKSDMVENLDQVQTEMEERFYEVITEWIDNMFNE